MLKENLVAARNAAGLNQSDIAKQLNITRQAYGAYERGVSVPDAETLLTLSKILKVSLDFLLGESDEKQKKPSTKEDRELESILDTALIAVYDRLTPQNRSALVEIGKTLLRQQDKESSDAN